MDMSSDSKHRQNIMRRNELRTANEQRMAADGEAWAHIEIADDAVRAPEVPLAPRRTWPFSTLVKPFSGGGPSVPPLCDSSVVNNNSSSPGMPSGAMHSDDASQCSSKRKSCDRRELEASEHITNIVSELARNCAIKHLVLSVAVEYAHCGDDLNEELLAEERDEGEEAYTISDAYLKDKLVFIWRVEQCCILRIHIAPDGLMQLPFQQISRVDAKADQAEWVRLQTRSLDDGPIEKELAALLDPSELRCSRLLSPCPRFGNVERKYVKILVKVELSLDEDGTQTVDLYQTIYCRMVGRDHRMPFRHFMRRCRYAWKQMPQTSRDGAEVSCFAIKSIFELIKGKML